MKKILLAISVIALVFPVLSFSAEYEFKVKGHYCFKANSNDGFDPISTFDKVKCGIFDEIRASKMGSEIKMKIEDNLFCVNDDCYSRDSKNNRNSHTLINHWKPSWEVTSCELSDGCDRSVRTKYGIIISKEGRTLYKEASSSRTWDVTGIHSTSKSNGIIFELEQ